MIDVGLAIATAGLDLNAMPKLAIARADWPMVHCFHARFGDGRYLFTSRSDSMTGGRRPRGELKVRFMVNVSGDQSGKAQVPTIPPQFRPKGALSEYHLLFEAVWQRQPTRDPMLLKRIGDDNDSPLFVVLAAWDLTPLEQAVLRAKL